MLQLPSSPEDTLPPHLVPLLEEQQKDDGEKKMKKLKGFSDEKGLTDSGGGSLHNDLIAGVLPDLVTARSELIDEVYKAPFRRVDNIITRLYDSTRLLQMHATVGEAARARYAALKWRWHLASAATMGGTGSLALILAFAAPALLEVSAGIGVLGIATTTGVTLYGRSQMELAARRIVSEDGLNDLFRHAYAAELADGDAYVPALWHRVRPQLVAEIAALGLDGMERVTNSQARVLRTVAEEEVPALRRLAAEERGRGSRRRRRRGGARDSEGDDAEEETDGLSFLRNGIQNILGGR